MVIYRPIIKTSLLPLEIILEPFTFTLLLFSWGYTWSKYSELPNTIPTHFNAQGMADNIGDKSTIWVLPIIFLSVYLLIVCVNQIPQYHKYMVRIMPDNILKNYKMSTQTLRIVKLFYALAMTHISYTVLQSSQHETANLKSWFLPLTIGISILFPILLFFRSKHINAKYNG